MYEICTLLAPKKKARKARVQHHKSCRVGARAIVGGKEVVIVEKDDRYKSAWFVAVDGVRHEVSFSKDMIQVL